MTARNQVQICISGLRRLLTGPGSSGPIRTVADGYQLRVADGELDW